MAGYDGELLGFDEPEPANSPFIDDSGADANGDVHVDAATPLRHLDTLIYVAN